MKDLSSKPKPLSREMTPDIESSARRAVACKSWRWMPGMAIVDSHGVREYVVGIAPLPEPGAWVANHVGVTWLSAEEMGLCLPDLSDPATLGCVLARVAQAHEVTLDDVHVVRTTGNVSFSLVKTWATETFRSDRASYVATRQPSRAEALVAALEAAP